MSDRDSPISRISPGLFASSCLGPTTPAVGLDSSTLLSAVKAFARGVVSSRRIHSSPDSTPESAADTASLRELLGGTSTTVTPAG